MVPSSRFALSLKPSVGYLVLNFCAGWKWQTMVPSLAYAGMPYHVLGARSGALAVTMAWIRSAITRSVSPISEIFSSTSRSPSALLGRGERLISLTRSFAAAFSSSVNVPDASPLVRFAVLFVAVFCSAMIPSLTPVVSASRAGFPAEPVRVGERPGVAGDGDPVRSGALRRDAGVLGQGPALVERQLDVRRRGGELDVLAAEAPRHRQAPLDVELLGRGDVRASQQEHDVVDLPGGRTGVLLRRRRDLPDRPVGVADDAAVAPQALRDGLDRRRAGVDGGADERVDRRRLRYHERQ